MMPPALSLFTLWEHISSADTAANPMKIEIKPIVIILTRMA
jgi:hypothetical protein